ncbi:hypothetical protein K469DRAFT_659430 [Zopfia rhizophila CBS 207.26]|uniref:Uncharacterized protein n=1 Tax=Zopfia rhizophila CBS 207.26 TaxID=1314779 RepID=A0A6A6EBE1_9PEZI|nr:hypothetical protein K469DRAFT_659430 [Zopfia rhizophila CBS 207.26]
MPDHPEPSPSSTSKPYNPIENAFARLPRPQKALDLSQPLVPTKYKLMVQDRAKSIQKRNSASDRRDKFS